MFSLVFFKVLSSLLSIGVGFGAGKLSKVQSDSIASLLFYLIAPIVFFAIPTGAKITINDFSIMIITYILCSLLGILTFFVYRKIWQDGHEKILALSAGTGNSGYVVLPIAASLFDDKTLSIYGLCIIGMDLYVASIGYCLCAQTLVSGKESLIRIAKLPILNAFFIGCCFSLMGFQLPSFLNEFIKNMQVFYSVLGMLMIGVAISEIKILKLDIKFITAAFFSKFIVFPLVFNIFLQSS